MASTDRTIYQIDIENLDKDAQQLPEQIEEKGRRLADAEFAMAEAKDEKELVYAELDLAIRSNPEQFIPGLKVVDKVIESAVLVQPPYKEAQQKYNQAKHLRDTLKTAVDSLHVKKSSIEVLDRQEARSYFSTPNITPESRQRRQTAIKQEVRKGISIKTRKEI